MKSIITFVILIFYTSLTLISSDKTNTDGLTRKHQSIYFEMSDGDLYHSSDFGYTFKKVYTNIHYVAILDKTPVLKETEQFEFGISSASIQNNSLHIELGKNITGFVNVTITDIEGRNETFTMDSNISISKDFSLLRDYKLAIVKLDFNKYFQIFKIIN